MKRLLYPSCGIEDALYFLHTFINEVDEFIFADLNFNSGALKVFENHLKRFGEYKKVVLGDFDSRWIYMRSLISGRCYRKIAPAYAIYDFKVKDRTKRLILRKGFGQFAILELNDDSLDIFVHRGDGIDEGGSGVFYLGNVKLDYEPISNIFDKLIKKLKDGALIISDGSNTNFKEFKQFYIKIYYWSKKEIEALFPVEIKIKNVTLKSERVLNKRPGHTYTIVWKIKK